MARRTSKRTKAKPPKKSGKKPPAKLTEKERRFVELYMGECAGNGTEAMRRAGYKGTDDALAAAASRLVRKDKVRAAIEERVAADPVVATRKERQQFWTDVMKGTIRAAMKDRLKASELLGKSQADFVDRHEHSGPDGKPIAHAVEVEFVKPDGKRASAI